MRFTKYSMLVVSILFFAFLSGVGTQTKEENGSKQWATFGEKIKLNNAELSMMFQEGNASGMSGRFGENTIFVTPTGERIHTQEEIAKFFSELMTKGVKEVSFKTVNVFITEISQENPDLWDYMGYEIGEYSYVCENMGGEVVTGSYVHAWRHRHVCKWFI